MRYPFCPQRIARVVQDRTVPTWTVAAEQLMDDAGCITWDVRLEHVSGTRTPIGPNRHVSPEPEMQRLVKQLDAVVLDLDSRARMSALGSSCGCGRVNP